MLAEMVSWFEKYGTAGLALNSFVESFFLVPPPDFLLIIMDLAKPEKALFYAFIATVFSTLGGIIGWLIGKYGGRPAFNWIAKGISRKSHNNKAQEYFEKIEKLYGEFGSMAVFLAAFTPIPYKVFTIASGILNMNVTKFTIASILGRGGRFFIVSLVLMFFGENVKNHIEWYIIGASAVIILFFVILYKKRHHFKVK